MEFISLFAGLGGFDLGFERAGMQCVAQVEINEFCQKVLQRHWPDVPKWRDVKNVGKHNLPTADLICGGFPCQPHSKAGKQKGKKDNRNLWPEFKRVVDEIRPAWVIAENVDGIRTTILDDVLSDLEGMEYKTVTLVIPACAFGAPHIRNRIFIIANTNGHRLQRFNSISSSKTRTLRKWIHIARVAGEVQQGKRDSIPESWIVRANDGLPGRVDRTRALGNAVIPQIAEWIGNVIVNRQNENPNP